MEFLKLISTIAALSSFCSITPEEQAAMGQHMAPGMTSQMGGGVPQVGPDGQVFMSPAAGSVAPPAPPAPVMQPPPVAPGPTAAEIAAQVEAARLQAQQQAEARYNQQLAESRRAQQALLDDQMRQHQTTQERIATLERERREAAFSQLPIEQQLAERSREADRRIEEVRAESVRNLENFQARIRATELSAYRERAIHSLGASLHPSFLPFIHGTNEQEIDQSVQRVREIIAAYSQPTPPVTAPPPPAPMPMAWTTGNPNAPVPNPAYAAPVQAIQPGTQGYGYPTPTAVAPIAQAPVQQQTAALTSEQAIRSGAYAQNRAAILGQLQGSQGSTLQMAQPNTSIFGNQPRHMSQPGGVQQPVAQPMSAPMPYPGFQPPPAQPLAQPQYQQPYPQQVYPAPQAPQQVVYAQPPPAYAQPAPQAYQAPYQPQFAQPAPYANIPAPQANQNPAHISGADPALAMAAIQRMHNGTSSALADGNVAAAAADFANYQRSIGQDPQAVFRQTFANGATVGPQQLN